LSRDLPDLYRADFNKVFDTIVLILKLGVIKSMKAEEILFKLKQDTKNCWNFKNEKKVQQSAFTLTKPNKNMF